MNAATAPINLISNILSLLDQMSDEVYIEQRESLHGSSFAAHFRHVLEFFELVVQAVDTGQIDYVDRQRNLMYERSLCVLKTGFKKVQRDLDAMTLDKTISIRGDISNGNCDIVSSVGRELLYAHDHAVHHLAIIKLGLSMDCPDITYSADMGIAASTLRYRASQQ